MMVNTVLEELNQMTYQGNIEVIKKLIIEAPTIFLSGKGRSGLMISAFANRLLHIDKQVHLIGEITTVHTTPGDLFIACSGSGESQAIVDQAKQAKQEGLDLVVITQSPNSSLAQLADELVVIKKLEDPQQPMGSFFEQSVLLFGDSLILTLMKQLDETSNSMAARHADIE